MLMGAMGRCSLHDEAWTSACAVILLNRTRQLIQYAVVFSLIPWIVVFARPTHAPARPGVNQIESSAQRSMMRRDGRGDKVSDAGVPAREQDEGLRAIAAADRDLLEKELGYGWCDERWLKVLKADDLDGDTAAEIVSLDKCTNLSRELVVMTDSTSPRIRARMAIILGRVDIPGARTHLKRLVNDTDEYVAAMALQSLCRTDAALCLGKISDVLSLEGRPRVRREALLLRDKFGPGPCENGWGYELHVVPAKEHFRIGNTITGTIAIKDKCSGPIVIAKPQLPSLWRVRYYGKQIQEKPMESWLGRASGRTPEDGHLGRYPADQYKTVRPGDTFSEPIDLGWYIQNRRDNLPEGCYGLTFWYHYTPNKHEEDLSLLQAVLASQEVQICITKAE